MHTLTKIKIFRILLWITYPICLIFIYPFAVLKKRNSTGLFFFLDRYVLGGAQRIHLDILESVPDIFKQVYFTRKSLNNVFKKEFYGTPNSDVRDIHFWCDNLLLRLFTVHYYAFYLNKHEEGHVFSSNSTFFYDLLPFLKKRLTKTELLHNFTHGKNGMEFFGLANHAYLDHRIVYDSFTLGNIKKQYRDYKIPAEYEKRILYIEPGVKIGDITAKNYAQPLRILYAGRGGVQKRIPLLNTIAEHCIGTGIPVEFHFAGDAIEELSNTVKANSVLHGNISKPENMYHLYEKCHAILMTSAYEGFPMLIKEGMANGCIPVVTALPGNTSHLKHNSNALLIFEPENEAGVVEQAVMLLEQLTNDLALLQNLSHNAYQYAKAHFDKENFMNTYRNLLLVHLPIV